MRTVRFESMQKEEILDRLKVVELSADEIIRGIKGLEEGKQMVIPKDGLPVSLNIDEVISPLGKIGRIFLYEDKEALEIVLRRYWALKGEPRCVIDILTADDGVYTLRSKLLKRDEDYISVKSLIERSRDILASSSVDKVVIAGNGLDKAELQFLVTSDRAEVKPGDYLDPGVFVSINGGVKVAAGVHRLVCTNGLTDMFYFWNESDLSFLRSSELFERAGHMLEWFRSKIGKKVQSVREIAAVFGTRYPKWVLDGFWKDWAEKIELGELDWYDVINDITNIANRRIDGLRYRLLEVGGYMVKVEEEEARCPVCNARIHIE